MSKLAAAEVCLEGMESQFSFRSFWFTFSKSLGKLRCRLAHKSISRPVNGKYRCWTCLQEFDTSW
jgi:hypothetical protein